MNWLRVLMLRLMALFQKNRLEQELNEELRYLPARLPDGREVVVPVNKVQVKFKGLPAS